MLPQGIFSVAVTTVIFPTLARLAARREYDDLRATMANGMRQIVLLLVPAAAAILVAVDADDPARLPARRVRGRMPPTWSSTALFWFAFSLPFNGLFLLLTRTFFSLQRPWVPTAISRRQPGDHGGRRGAAVLAVRGRRDRRGDGDRDCGERGRADRGSAAPVGQARAWAIRLDDDSRDPRCRGPGRGQLRDLVRPRPGARARARSRRSSRSGPRSGPAALVYAAAITLFRIPEAHQIWRLLRRRAV